MNIGEWVQAVEVIKFTKWFEQWQQLVLSGMDGNSMLCIRKQMEIS